MKQPKGESVSIVNAGKTDFYYVSCGKPINYNIEQNIPNEKRTAMRYLLKNIFGYDDFNQGQQQIISNMLNRRKTIGILPTGGGKSLCYQYAAILQPGVSFSVCPISSLSQDQKDNLDELGFTRTNYIISDQSREEKKTILDNFAKGRYQLIWISPERFQSEEFRDRLESLHTVCYAVVDEVHCLSEWGHDFRTSYLTLIPTIENFCPEAVIVGLTATASQAVLKDLKIEFNIDQYGIRALPSLQRENLIMRVIQTEDKLPSLKEILSDKSMVNESTVGIIFTLYKDKSGDRDRNSNSFTLLDEIQDIRRDLTSEKFHAQINDKRGVQERFKQDKINILSTTKAFGMGINKDDVRYTIHFGLPWSVEAFYQEAGRAGRGQNKKIADCFILYSPEKPSLHQTVLKLFERDTTPEEVKDIQARNKNDLNDIGNIFYLWELNNHGVERDILDIGKVIEKFSYARKEKDQEERQYCLIEEDSLLKKDRLELALYRLKLLGRVTDWTIEWGTVTRFKCFLAEEYTSENAREAMFNYIRRYDPTFGEPWTGDTEKYRAMLENNTIADLRKCALVLLSWSYDHIAYSRRRMIYNIKEFCEHYTDPDSFRKRIDDFLRISESNVMLEGIVESPLNWRAWFELFVDSETVEGEGQSFFLSRENCAALRDTTARYLESYRDVTGLNLVYCIAGALSGTYNSEMDHEIIASALSDFSEKYAETDEILEALLSFLTNHYDSFEELGIKDIADGVCEQYPEKAEYCYKHFGNMGALTILLNQETQRIRNALLRCGI